VVDAQKYYDLEKINVEWCAKNNYYDLEKVNVEDGLALSPQSRPKLL
jgi:predicted transglutaminase-like protease